MEQAQTPKKSNLELERVAAQKASERSRNARWDLDIAVFLFAVLIIVIILLFQQIRVEAVAPIAIFGLAMVWLVGWRRGRQLYDGFYKEELAKLEKNSEKKAEPTLEETVEDKVQKALRERLTR